MSKRAPMTVAFPVDGFSCEARNAHRTMPQPLCAPLNSVMRSTFDSALSVEIDCDFAIDNTQLKFELQSGSDRVLKRPPRPLSKSPWEAGPEHEPELLLRKVHELFSNYFRSSQESAESQQLLSGFNITRSDS